MLEYYKLTWWSAACPLSPYARLVHSFLTYRARKGLSASQREIAKSLRLNATNNVRPALTELSDRGLVGKQKGEWVAKPFPPEWVCCGSKKAAAPEWWGKRNDFLFGVPTAKCPLTTHQVLVYCLLLHYFRYSQRRTSYGSLSRVTGLNKKQVARAVKKLIGLNLVTKSSIAQALFKPVVQPAPPGWFGERKKRVTTDSVPATGSLYYDRILNELAPGTKPDLLKKIAALIVALEKDSMDPYAFFDCEEFVTKTYRQAKRQFKTGANCASLFFTMLVGKANRLNQS